LCNTLQKKFKLIFNHSRLLLWWSQHVIYDDQIASRSNDIWLWNAWGQKAQNDHQIYKADNRPFGSTCSPNFEHHVETCNGGSEFETHSAQSLWSRKCCELLSSNFWGLFANNVVLKIYLF
jgi:hypothetical protein